MPLAARGYGGRACIYRPPQARHCGWTPRITPRRNNIMVCYGYYADYAVSVQSRTNRNRNWGGRERAFASRSRVYAWTELAGEARRDGSAEAVDQRIDHLRRKNHYFTATLCVGI